MSRGKRYTAEFKAQAVALVVEAGRSALVVARELGINVNTLHSWLKQARDEDSDSNTSEAAIYEIKRLKKELAQAQMERDILKKAAAYFAKEAL